MWCRRQLAGTPHLVFGGIMPVYPVALSYRDLKGRTSWIRAFVSSATLAGAANQVQNQWIPGIAAVTNAALANANGPYALPPTTVTYGTNAIYADCEDKLRCFVTTATGITKVMDIPAPKKACFLTDGETWDPSFGPFGNLNLVFSTRGMCDRDGHLFTGLFAAMRVRIPLHRKAGLYVKNPQLTTTVL